MFSWLTDLSKHKADAEAIWMVISSVGVDRCGHSWAALVDALTYSCGEFAFEFDSDLGRLDDSVLVRFRNNESNRMETRLATVIARIDPPGELTRVRVLVDECDCGAEDCDAGVCYEAGRFVRRAPVWQAAA